MKTCRKVSEGHRINIGCLEIVHMLLLLFHDAAVSSERLKKPSNAGEGLLIRFVFLVIDFSVLFNTARHRQNNIVTPCKSTRVERENKQNIYTSNKQIKNHYTKAPVKTKYKHVTIDEIQHFNRD